MDILDTSKLLRTSRLDQVLESLACCEDSNAKDSIYSKSTTMDAEDLEFDGTIFFGESLKRSKDSPETWEFSSGDLNSSWELENDEFVRKPLDEDCFKFFDKRGKV